MPLENPGWTKIGDPNYIDHSSARTLESNTIDEWMGVIEKKTYLVFYNVSQGDNGTYECRARNMDRRVVDRKHLIVTEVPEVKIDFANAVGAGRVYLNWTIIYDGNDPINMYFIQRMEKGTNKWENCSLAISGQDSSYVVKGLEKSTAYRFRIYASNSAGTSLPAESGLIQTLAEG